MTGLRAAVAWLLLCGGMLLAAHEASAQTVCRPQASPLAFGNVDPAGSADATGNVTVSCETGGVQLLTIVSVRACLSIGGGSAGGSGIAPYRQMRTPAGDALQFQIYQDPARTRIWGSESIPGSEPVRVDHRYQIVLGSGATSTFQASMFGRVPPQSGLAAGAYQNAFDGVHTALDYRYNQNLLIPIWPSSCTSGGQGGGRFIRFPFTASATVPGRCTIDAATDLDFGNVPGLIDSSHDQASTITMTCTSRTAWNVALDDGQNASGSVRRMRMDGGDRHVAYELYRDPARTLRWGTTPGADTLEGTGTGDPQQVTVHGRVPAGQSVPAGTYRDTITVTVTY